MEKQNLTRYLEDVESRIDTAEEQRLAREWENFCALQCHDPFFSPRRTPKPSFLTWPDISVNQSFVDVNSMLYAQLKEVSDQLSSETGLLLHVRANYGTGILPTMFGAELFFLPDEADMLPGTRSLPDGMETLKTVTAAGMADNSCGLFPVVFAFGRKWREMTEDYPRIQQYVYLCNPDFQGPFSLADMLAGDALYYSMYDEPEQVHQAMNFLTEVYLQSVRQWQDEFPPYDEEHSVEWGLLHRGKLILRNDAVTNISDAMYREFILPYDQRCFREMGGGMHFCGRGDHYIASACVLENLSCINLSQPELNDMETIYAASVDQGKIILGMPVPEISRATAAGRNLRGRVQSGASIAAYRKRDK